MSAFVQADKRLGVIIPLGQSFFIFSFYRPFQPNFLEIEKKIRDFFQFYFFISLRLMPVQYLSSILSFLLQPG